MTLWSEIATGSLQLRALKAVLLLLALPVHAHTALECYTPLLRDVIAQDSSKLRYTLRNLGESDSAFIRGLPTLNSSSPLTIRLPGFTTPSLLLEERSSGSPLYWITALDIQQGAAGVDCTSSAVVEEISVEVRLGGGYWAIDTPFREGRDRSNSNPTINLKKLGGSVGNGRVVRFSLQPIAGDGIRIKVLSIDPLTSTVMNEVCMRMEIYGCEVSGSSPPSVNAGPLHQYNLIQASADTYGNLYTDSSYTGITSDGYLSGGTGILTDGTVGREAADTPVEWVGWGREETVRVDVLFLFKRRKQINRINLYYWEDEVSGLGTVRISDQNNATIPLHNLDVSNVTQRLKLLSLSRDSLTGVSYIELSLEYGTHSDTILITEIQIVGDVLGSATNLVTGENITTQTSFTTHSTTPMLNSTSPHTTRRTMTSSEQGTTTQIATTNTTQIAATNTTQITTTNTTQIATTNTTQITATNTTQITKTNTTQSPHSVSHISNNITSTTKYSVPNLSTTEHSSNTTPFYPNASSNTFHSSNDFHSSATALTNACCSQQTVLLTAVGAGLSFSLCLNLILILIFTWCCCCYCCCGYKRSKVELSREGGEEEEGNYVPMKSVELRNYHILDTTESGSASKTRERIDTEEYHYYSQIEDSPDSKMPIPEKNKYYPFH